MHQFSIREVVTCSVRYSAPGDYKILACMPDRDGDHMYRIKSPLEEYERNVKESALVRSDELLPDEVRKKRPIGRRTITLPSLVPSVQARQPVTCDLEIA
jgi:hypothetical protein